jgi:hypothetical protein
MNLDILKENKVKWIIATLGALGGFVALLVHLEQKKHNKAQKELMALDKEIKTLQLSKLKNSRE